MFFKDVKVTSVKSTPRRTLIQRLFMSRNQLERNVRITSEVQNAKNHRTEMYALNQRRTYMYVANV